MSFSGDGIVTTDFAGQPDQANAVAVQPDGKIVVAGQATTGGSTLADGDFALARYNTDGTPDMSFDGDGLVLTDLGTTADVARAVAIRPDGRIVVAGTADGDVALVRYTDKGEVDESFGDHGKRVTDFGSDDFANGLALTGDGHILVAGHTLGAGLEPRLRARPLHRRGRARHGVRHRRHRQDRLRRRRLRREPDRAAGRPDRGGGARLERDDPRHGGGALPRRREPRHRLRRGRQGHRRLPREGRVRAGRRDPAGRQDRRGRLHRQRHRHGVRSDTDHSHDPHRLHRRHPRAPAGDPRVRSAADRRRRLVRFEGRPRHRARVPRGPVRGVARARPGRRDGAHRGQPRSVDRGVGRPGRAAVPLPRGRGRGAVRVEGLGHALAAVVLRLGVTTRRGTTASASSPGSSISSRATWTS